MAADTGEAAGRPRTGAGYRRGCDGGDTLLNRRHCGFAGGVATASGIGNPDMHAYGLSDKLAGFIDLQSS